MLGDCEGHNLTRLSDPKRAWRIHCQFMCLCCVFCVTAFVLRRVVYVFCYGGCVTFAVLCYGVVVTVVCVVVTACVTFVVTSLLLR